VRLSDLEDVAPYLRSPAKAGPRLFVHELHEPHEQLKLVCSGETAMSVRFVRFVDKPCSAGARTSAATKNAWVPAFAGMSLMGGL